MKLTGNIDEAIENMNFRGNFLDKRPYGSGHINDTFLVRFKNEDGEITKYILQRINHLIFKNPYEVMDNIAGVTEFLADKIKKSGGNPQRETMHIVPCKNGKYCFCDSTGCYWRSYFFIENTISLDRVENPKDFYESAVAFGHFQCMLSDYPADTLHETIPDFHNTPKRFIALKNAAEKDICGRADLVREEIRFFMERKKEMNTLALMQKEGKLPLRVTHNDTKLNNVLLDRDTGKAVCVADLDTVMPGLSVHDFGDSIRFGANTGEEDEQDLSKVSLDLNLFDSYTRGFLEGCCGSLTPEEVTMLPMGAKMMTMECGMRFLTDYLEGDVYFKIHRDGHNLDRCRSQSRLALDMEQKWSEMQNIVSKYR